MIESCQWHCEAPLQVCSAHHEFSIPAGIHVAQSALVPFADSSRNLPLDLRWTEYLWNFHDSEYVWWRHTVMLRPEDWLPEEEWRVHQQDAAWKDVDFTILPVRIAGTRIHAAAERLNIDNPSDLYWSFRYKVIEPSDYFTIQMGVHRTSMCDLHKPVGLWEYRLPFSHWLWRPGTRYTETSVEPQALAYCDIERVQPPKGHTGPLQIRGLGRSPVTVTPRGDVSACS